MFLSKGIEPNYNGLTFIVLEGWLGWDGSGLGRELWLQPRRISSETLGIQVAIFFISFFLKFLTKKIISWNRIQWINVIKLQHRTLIKSLPLLVARPFPFSCTTRNYDWLEYVNCNWIYNTNNQVTNRDFPWERPPNPIWGTSYLFRIKLETK